MSRVSPGSNFDYSETITVSELIDALREFSPDLPVVVICDNIVREGIIRKNISLSSYKSEYAPSRDEIQIDLSWK